LQQLRGLVSWVADDLLEVWQQKQQQQRRQQQRNTTDTRLPTPNLNTAGIIGTSDAFQHCMPMLSCVVTAAGVQFTCCTAILHTVAVQVVQSAECYQLGLLVQ
jgi:transcriptional regulator with GAF, ATPase, and Fis domain